VCDSNVLISYLWGSKTIETIVEAMMVECRLVPLVSHQMLAEFHAVISRPKLAGINSLAISAFTKDLTSFAELSYPQRRIRCCEDPDDNMILECACEGNADYIISGDRHLLVLNPFEGIPILTPGEFVRTVLNRLKR